MMQSSSLNDFMDFGSNTFRKSLVGIDSQKSFKVKVKKVIFDGESSSPKEIFIKIEVINNNNEIKEILNCKRGKTFKFGKLKYPGELSLTFYDMSSPSKKLPIKDFEVMIY